MNHSAFGLDGPRLSLQLQNSFAYLQQSCHEQDSSMVAIDKRRAGKAMDLLWWLITQLRFKLEFSWGDKESFWLAFELAQQPCAFSPWGVSVVSSYASDDMGENLLTLCGSIAQYYAPGADDTEPVLFCVNGKALLEAIPQGIYNNKARPNVMYNEKPTHVSPRLVRQRRKPSLVKYMPKSMRGIAPECLTGFGSVPMPPEFAGYLFRRRLHFLAANSEMYDPLAVCEFRWA